MVIITIIGMAMLAMTFIYLANIAPAIFAKNYSLLPNLVLGLCFVVVMPLSIYFTAKKSYATTERLQEEIEYTFTNETMTLTGESFKTEMSWEKTYKIEELQNWFLIFHSKKIANLIPKSDLTPGQVLQLRTLLKGVKNVKLFLK